MFIFEITADVGAASDHLSGQLVSPLQLIRVSTITVHTDREGPYISVHRGGSAASEKYKKYKNAVKRTEDR